MNWRQIEIAEGLDYSFNRNTNRIGRLRWWLLQHVGYYCEGTENWRWWMRPARWAWIATGWLPRSALFR